MRVICKALCAAFLMVAATSGTARADNVALIRQFSCRDVRGTAVVLQFIPRREDASVLNGVPVIQLDPHMIDSIPPVIAEFLYFHECGHHALGHVAAAVVNGPYFASAISPQAEYEADCFALASIKNHGASEAEIQTLFGFLSRFTDPVAGHPTGPQRVALMHICTQ